MMKAVVVSSFKDKEVAVKEIPKPEPQAGEIVIRVEAAPINPSDQYEVAGSYNNGTYPAPPFTPGLEACG